MRIFCLFWGSQGASYFSAQQAVWFRNQQRTKGIKVGEQNIGDITQMAGGWFRS
jgi:hypothetical protein